MRLRLKGTRMYDGIHFRQSEKVKKYHLTMVR